VVFTEGERSGTVSGIREALPYLSEDLLLVINGDTFCPIDLDVLENWHREASQEWTIVSHKGVNAGIWLMYSDVFHDIVNLGGTDREELIPADIALYEGPHFIDIGTPEGLQQAYDTFQDTV